MNQVLELLRNNCSKNVFRSLRGQVNSGYEYYSLRYLEKLGVVENVSFESSEYMTEGYVSYDVVN